MIYYTKMVKCEYVEGTEEISFQVQVSARGTFRYHDNCCHFERIHNWDDNSCCFSHIRGGKRERGTGYFAMADRLDQRRR